MAVIRTAKLIEWHNWLESLDDATLKRQRDALQALDPMIIKEFEGVDLVMDMIEAEIAYRKLC